MELETSGDIVDFFIIEYIMLRKLKADNSQISLVYVHVKGVSMDFNS